jgi:hypothetical protein
MGLREEDVAKVGGCAPARWWLGGLLLQRRLLPRLAAGVQAGRLGQGLCWQAGTAPAGSNRRLPP